MISADFRKQFADASLKLIREHNIAVEALTESQLSEAFMQAVACGDFTRLVTTDERQSVIYVPFANEQQHLSEINRLRELLKANGIPSEQEDYD